MTPRHQSFRAGLSSTEPWPCGTGCMHGGHVGHRGRCILRQPRGQPRMPRRGVLLLGCLRRGPLRRAPRRRTSLCGGQESPHLLRSAGVPWLPTSRRMTTLGPRPRARMHDMIHVATRGLQTDTHPSLQLMHCCSSATGTPVHLLAPLSAAPACMRVSDRYDRWLWGCRTL